MKYSKFYFLSLLAIVLICAYPIYMGVVTLGSYMKNVSIHIFDYPQYVIPFTPICIALIASTALMPLFFKLQNRYTLPAVSALGAVLFIIIENRFEQIKVIGSSRVMPILSHELKMRMISPEVFETIGDPLYEVYSPAFKIHFYFIAIIMIFAILNVVYGFTKMVKEQVFIKKSLVVAQAVSILIFIGLCILACFTDFYRNGGIYISPLSAALMAVFFIVAGITAGIYTGSLFYQKSRFLFIILPTIIALLTTFIMYIGELKMLGGVLFNLGYGVFYYPISPLPFSAADISVMLLSSIFTYFIMNKLYKSGRKLIPLNVQ